MDNKVFRSFALRFQERSHEEGKSPVLIMHSAIEGEYGPMQLTIIAELEVDSPSLRCTFTMTSGASLAEQHSFRSNELSYFVRFILPLFNPLTLYHDEVPFPSASESQNS